MSASSAVVHPLVCGAAPARPWDPGLSDPFPFPVARVDADQEALVAAHGQLPAGAATDEAIAVLLRRNGAALEMGVAEHASRSVFLRRMYASGRDSVGVARARGDLLPELMIGTWAAPDVSDRLRRTIALRAPRWVSERRPDGVAAGERAFWLGVREAASSDEWEWLTASYSVLLYHRLAGEYRRGQQRLDMPPETFRRQLRTLRRFGIGMLEPDEVIRFHDGERPPPARRHTVVTVDDATADVVGPLGSTDTPRVQLFVVSGAVGGPAHWLDGTPLARWEDLRHLSALGVAVGAHTRSHPSDLTAAADQELRNEVDGSRRDIAEALGSPPTLFAYPNGRLDARVRRVVAEAGFSLAYSTRPGVNGAGTDRYSLRRVSAKAWDTRASILWKAVTGEPPPRLWERWLMLRYALGRRYRRSRA